MATRYAVGSGAWSNTSTVWSDTDGGAPGSFVPVDGDTFVILAGVSVLMDADQSAWTGLASNNIIRGGASPGMLYFASGTSGYLKLRTGATLQGTTSTNRGRLLANSDGVWGNTGALPFTDKAVIECAGTAQIQALHIDIRLYCYQPTTKFLRTYASKYDFNAATAVTPATDVIDLGTTPPGAGTAVRVAAIAGATLPTGLNEYDLYYVRSVSGNTCKLSHMNNDTGIVDITAVGSGTCTLITGHTNTSTAAMNVLDDVTGETGWTSTDGHDRVVLVDWGPTTNDIQKVSLASIDSATQVTLSANVDSAQYPGARIYLSARNVSIRTSNTGSSTQMVTFSTATHTGAVFQCELVCTAATANNTGINAGVSSTVSGTVTGFTTGLQGPTDATVSGNVVGNTTAVGSSTRGTFSGHFQGTTYGFNAPSAGTMSGLILGCNSGLYYSTGRIVVSGTIVGCQYGLNTCAIIYCTGNLRACQWASYATSNLWFGGECSGASSGGFLDDSDARYSGLIVGCTYAISTSYRYAAYGLTIARCTTGIQGAGPKMEGSHVTFTGNGTDNGHSYAGELARVPIAMYGGAANNLYVYGGGGTITHETTEVPATKTYSHKFTFTASVAPGGLIFHEWPITRPTAAALSIPVYAKNGGTGLTADERIHWAIVDPSNDPWLKATGAYLDSFTADDNNDWQTDTLTYTKTDDRPLFLRVWAVRTSAVANAYAYSEVQTGGAGGGGLLTHPGMAGGCRG